MIPDNIMHAYNTLNEIIPKSASSLRLLCRFWMATNAAKAQKKEADSTTQLLVSLPPNEPGCFLVSSAIAGQDICFFKYSVYMEAFCWCSDSNMSSISLSWSQHIGHACLWIVMSPKACHCIL